MVAPRRQGMKQWAPGTRLSRMNREDGVYEAEMEQLKKRVEEREKEVEEPIDPGFVEGDLIMCQGQIYRAGPLGRGGRSVLLQNLYWHGTEMCCRLPELFVKDYLNCCKVLKQEPI